MRTNPLFWLISIVFFNFCSQPSPISDKKTSIKKDSLELNNNHPSKEQANTIEVDSDYLLGKFEPSKHPDFTAIQSIHTTKTGIYLRKDAYEAFVKMYDAAQKDGINLKIISATRNFNSQKTIWEAKWNGDRIVEGKNLARDVKDSVERARIILRYSSMPGTSRHHWGTDIDINALEDGYFTKGQGKKEYDWLVENGPKYGFCQPYSPKGEKRPNGYEEEKWHWSYLPVSSQLIRQYQEKVKYQDIKGFKGCGTAQLIDVIPNYVRGVSEQCNK